MSFHTRPTEVHATVVEDPIIKIQIPAHLRPGDSFIFHDPQHGPITIVVPPNALPGSYLTVVVPSRVLEQDEDVGCSRPITLDKAAIGATVAAGIVGVVVAGTLGGVILAGGAAYLATAKRDTSLGTAVRSAGDKAVKGAGMAKKWLSKQLQDRSSPTQSINSSSSSGSGGTHK